MDNRNPLSEPGTVIGGEALRAQIKAGKIGGVFYWSDQEAGDLELLLRRYSNKQKGQQFAARAAEPVGLVAERMADFAGLREPYTPAADLADLAKADGLLSDLLAIYERLGEWGFSHMVRACEDFDLIYAGSHWERIDGKLAQVGHGKMYPDLLQKMQAAVQAAAGDLEIESLAPSRGKKAVNHRHKLYLSAWLAGIFESVFNVPITKTVDGPFAVALGFAFEALGLASGSDNRRLIGETQELVKEHAGCVGQVCCQLLGQRIERRLPCPYKFYKQ